MTSTTAASSIIPYTITTIWPTHEISYRRHIFPENIQGFSKTGKNRFNESRTSSFLFISYFRPLERNMRINLVVGQLAQNEAQSKEEVAIGKEHDAPETM